MKHWKKIGVMLSVFTILSTAHLKAQDTCKTILFKAVETYKNIGNFTSYLMVIDPNGKSSSVELERLHLNSQKKFKDAMEN